jgi:hypothetical protein
MKGKMTKTSKRKAIKGGPLDRSTVFLLTDTARLSKSLRNQPDE